MNEIGQNSRHIVYMVVQLSGVLDRQFGGGVKWPNADPFYVNSECKTWDRPNVVLFTTFYKFFSSSKLDTSSSIIQDHVFIAGKTIGLRQVHIFFDSENICRK